MHTSPYIGITGVKTPEESDQLVQMVQRLGLPSTHRLMIGALGSYKGLSRGIVSDPLQYLQLEDMPAVFPNDWQALNIVHYNSRASGLYAQIRDILRVVDNADGIQLNIIWPEPDILRRLRETSYTVVILQVSDGAYAQLGYRPEALVRRLQEYEGLIEYVLIDPSGGSGRRFEMQSAQRTLSSLMKSGLKMNWGIAGGLGPAQLESIRGLLELVPNLSWDAQSRLRTDDGQGLDLAACEKYLKQGIAMLHERSG